MAKLTKRVTAIELSDASGAKLRMLCAPGDRPPAPTPFEQEMRALRLATLLTEAGWLGALDRRGSVWTFQHRDGRHFAVDISGPLSLTPEAMGAMVAALADDKSPPDCPLAFTFAGERGSLSVTVGLAIWDPAR
jgi:hypothetical protein